MKHIFINPMPGENNGIASYIQSIKELKGSEIEIINNNKLSIEQFRQHVAETITKKYGTEEIIIESPEAKASTLYIPSDYKVHIRLHCPLAIAQKYDDKQINQIEFSHELRVINKATIVSSPSYALAKELQNETDTSKFSFYKNPIALSLKNEPRYSEDKKFDLIFMGRFQNLKGAAYINKILEKLPSNMKVLLMGTNATAYKLSPNIACSVTKQKEITSDKRFELLREAKVLMLLSKFENCSMVILEALACHVPVVSWDVGGNKEIANNTVLSCAKFEDFDDLVNRIMLFIKTPPLTSDFESSLNIINDDFSKGFDYVKNYLLNDTHAGHSYRGIDFSKIHKWIKKTSPISKRMLVENKKPRVFGIAYSNEHVEELWAPIIDWLGYEHRYVCRRPLGYHSVFKHPPYPINKNWYCVFDWIKDPNRLLSQISGYRPNFILFHNGDHPSYDFVLKKIKLLGIPIVYSELGWFPQRNHVYFDCWGVNGKSYISSLSFEQLCNQHYPCTIQEKKVKGEFALIVLQLENDTNLIINSPKFKNNESFIRYVLRRIGSKTKFIIKPHPLDKNTTRYEKFCSDNVSLVSDEPIENLLSRAHSVIGINSTVLLQSLDYPVNIYSFGFSILDNKNIVIDCKNNHIDRLWSNNLFGTIEARKILKNELCKRQINLLDIRSNKVIAEDIEQAIEPLVKTRIFDFSHLINLSKTEKVLSSTELNKINQHKNYSVSHKKLNKLRRTPILFFKDLFKNVYRGKKNV